MRLAFFLLVIVLGGACLFFTAVSYAAAPAHQLATDISEEQLAAMEQKLLQKTYSNDPLPKRLQRLELSLWGATQYGNDEQRWHNIKQYLSSAKTPNRAGKSQSNISASLNELEKYIFKRQRRQAKQRRKRLHYD